MSLAIESPTHRGSQGNDAYFTPLGGPNNLASVENAGEPHPNNNNSHESNDATTPFYTAPINPSIHQEFLNAIQARQASQPTVLSSPSSEQQPRPILPMGSLANRRLVLQQTLKTPVSDQGGSLPFLTPIDPSGLNRLLVDYQQNPSGLLILDVRSFVQFSHSRIRHSINVSIPNTILKRPTFTLDKVYEAIVLHEAREKLRTWQNTDYILFYDQQSQLLQENSACAYLATKLHKAGYKGKLHFLKGGFESLAQHYKDQIETTAHTTSQGPLPAGPPTSLGVGGAGFSLNLNAANRRPTLRLNNLLGATPSLGPFTAPMPQFDNQAFNPFFSNIRQNMELSHGPIRERFPIRLPTQCEVQSTGVRFALTQPRCPPGCQTLANDLLQVPAWLLQTVQEQGAKLLAENYEKLERTEQRRLQNIMHFHSKHTSNPAEFPFSIVAGIEMGALNRYTNIWPYEYTRVKLRDFNTSDYINASYIQYMDSDEGVSDARPETLDTHCIKKMKTLQTQSPYRRYISTQGPLPATFPDFWQIVWEQNARVIVMLTKEEEMNKIKCHRYWPSHVNETLDYGHTQVTLTEQTLHKVKSLGDQKPNEEDTILARKFRVCRQGQRRSVTQLHYTGWMDFGVPDNPLGTLQVIDLADRTQKQYHQLDPTVGPMVVHCSAGCGRSGAFCTIDTALYRLARQDSFTVDLLLETIARFREQRLSMVQTLRQFVFCYEALWWWLLGYGQDQIIATPAIDDMDTSL
ncbi:protein-tyrosine phosphatase-like protein [Sporodiniella umbellata]|nr:protein-tyrosine phosphatase-like protein [Sporodiniella umbellata]